MLCYGCLPLPLSRGEEEVALLQRSLQTRAAASALWRRCNARAICGATKRKTSRATHCAYAWLIDSVKRLNCMANWTGETDEEWMGKTRFYCWERVTCCGVSILLPSTLLASLYFTVASQCSL